MLAPDNERSDGNRLLRRDLDSTRITVPDKPAGSKFYKTLSSADDESDDIVTPLRDGSTTTESKRKPIFYNPLTPETPWLMKVNKYHGKEQTEAFSFGVAVCFTINYIMGSGFLSVPWAFSQAGYVLGVIAILLVSYILNITKNYVLESMARAEAITVDKYVECSKPTYEVTNRKFSITELMKLFGGKKAEVGYVFIFSLYMYGALWAYVSVFANSMASSHLFGENFLDKDTMYVIYALGYGTLVTILATLELKEQVTIQGMFSAVHNTCVQAKQWCFY